MAAKPPAGAKDAPAQTGHYIVACARPGLRRGGRVWETASTTVPATEMPEELLAALEADAAFSVSGPFDVRAEV